MGNTKVTDEDFAVLEAIYGNHTQAAKAIGVDRRHYRRLRAGKFVGGMAARIVALAAKDAQRESGAKKPTRVSTTARPATPSPRSAPE